MGAKNLIFLLFSALLFAEGFTKPTTYKALSSLDIYASPDGETVANWETETIFTSNISDGEFVKVTGYFPNGKWQSAPESWWVKKESLIDISPAETIGKPTISTREIVVEKSKFLLTVIERIGDKTFEIYTTKVGLGIDGCKSKEKGGKCYYTLPGEYKVEFKVYNPNGIEWCIPKSMEEEYKTDIEAGRRCFRGSLGKYALNIGSSYAIHGTSNPKSIGKKASHGCIRVLNQDAEYLYRLMNKDDKVTIVE